jgi:ABC-2 type transport system permease protein
MYAQIIRHETRTLARAPAFAWVLALLVAAIVFGAWSGARSLAWRAQGEAAMVAGVMAERGKLHDDLAAYEKRMAAQGRAVEVAVYSHSPRGPIPQGTNPGTLGATSAAPAVLPATGLAAFATGQNDLQLAYLPVSAQSLPTITQDSELGNPVNLRQGAFDIAFVVIFVLPIFILAISYDMLSSERERGTLAMVLSHPVSLRKLMTSKVVSRAAIILAVVLAGGLGALLTIGGALDSPDTWARFGLWLVATLLYSLFWFALAVLVNALGRHSATNGVVLAGAWLALVVVAPALVGVLATTAYPAPSRFDFITTARDAQTRSEKGYMQALDRYYYDHLEYVPDAKVNDFLATTMAKKAAVDKELAPLYARFRSQLAKQDRMVAGFQFVSPAIMMQRTLNDASGASAARYSHFLDQVAAFRGEWVDYFTVRFLKGVALKSDEYAQFPSFRYREEGIGTVLARTAPSLAGLALLMLAVALGAVQALRRYRVAG